MRASTIEGGGGGEKVGGEGRWEKERETVMSGARRSVPVPTSSPSGYCPLALDTVYYKVWRLNKLGGRPSDNLEKPDNTM